MKNKLFISAFAIFVMIVLTYIPEGFGQDAKNVLSPSGASATGGIYAFQAQSIGGETKKLSDYQGKVLLIVNTASRCGFTYQYKSLQVLYDKLKDRGFEVLAFPSNNFMNQEPGTNEEIKKFCETTFQTAFPLFSKIDVQGKNIHPLYQYLTTRSGFNGPITWNFNKFLVNSSGVVIARFDSPVDPLSPDIVMQIENVLPKK